MPTLEHSARTSEVQLAPLFEQYLMKVKRRGGKASTVYNSRRAFIALQVWLNANSLAPEDVTGDTLFDYFEQSKYAPATNLLHATKIKAAYAYGKRRGDVEVDPFDEDDGIALPKLEPTDPNKKLIPADELRTAQWHADRKGGNARLLFYLLAYTGMRRDEIRLLQWKDLDLTPKNESASFVGKGGLRRTIPLHPELVTALARHEHDLPRPRVGYVLSPTNNAIEDRDKGLPYTSGQALVKLKESFAPDTGFHNFRKTFAMSLDFNGVRENEVRLICGWARQKVWASYVGVNLESLREAILRAYENDPLKPA